MKLAKVQVRTICASMQNISKLRNPEQQEQACAHDSVTMRADTRTFTHTQTQPGSHCPINVYFGTTLLKSKLKSRLFATAPPRFFASRRF